MRQLILFSAIWTLSIVFANNETFQEKTANYWNEEGQKTLSNILQGKFNTNVAKNIIVFIGDGMGISTVTAARILKSQEKREETELIFETFPHTALVKTYNVDYQVPDSAGTATAIFTGVKTNKAMLGVTAETKLNDCNSSIGNEITSILQWAQKEGKATGIVTTTRVTDATPAALYCHSASRNWESDDLKPDDAFRCKDIARQLIEDDPGKNIQVILGSGRQHFLATNVTDKDGNSGQRKDGQNLIQNWLDQKKQMNAQSAYVTNKEELLNVDLNKTDYLLGFFAANNMDYEADRNKNESKGQPSLRQMTKVAIELLRKNTNGYFLMVEGARIDHGHHENKAAKALEDTLAFDKAIKKALKLVDLSDTLIIVTADHSHVMTINGYPKRETPILGISQMSDVDNLPYTTLLYTNGPSAINNTFKERENLTETMSTNKDYTQESLIPMGRETHGGEDVAIYAIGPMAHLFQSVIEQNYIAHALAYASCVGVNQAHCKSSSTNVNSIFLLTVILPLLVYVASKDE